jgi:hypothetical protein
VLAFFVRLLGVEGGLAGDDRHADEVDEVACDHDAPAVAARPLAAVMREKRHEISVDRRRTPHDVVAAIVQVAAQVDIGEHEQALGDRRRRQERPHLPVLP